MKKVKAKVKSGIRVLTALLVVALLLGVSAFVVIISQGKQITLDGKVLDTSIIRVDVVPQDVKVFVNDKEVSLNENRIENLAPGDYKLQFTKKGYTSWEKEVSVEAGIVKDVHAQLYPEDIKFTTLTDSNIDKVFYSDDADFLFYTILTSKKPAENGIWKLKLTRNILDFSENKPFQVARFDADLLKQMSKNYTLKISGDDNKILLDVDKSISNIYDANQLNSLFDLDQKLGFVPTRAEWLRNSDSLMISKDNLLFEYDINSNQSTLINYNNDINSIFTNNFNTVYYVKDSKLYKYLNRNSTLVTLPLAALELVTNIHDIKTSTYNSDIIVFNCNSGLVLVDLSKSFVDIISAKGTIISLSSNGKSIIYENNGALYSYILEDSIDGKSYRHTTNPLGVNQNDIYNIYFSPSGKNIISLEKAKSGARNLILMDFDGNNKKQLINNFTISGDSILISKDSTELYILIKAKSVDNVDTNNIYKFNLEATPS